MSRHERQRVELLRLCRAGAASRALDLAFQHFADFGPDRDLLARLAEAVDLARPCPALRRRLTELRVALERTQEA